MHKNKFRFTEHSLSRGLERMFGMQPPYTQQHYDNVKTIILRSMKWFEIVGEWRLEDYELRLIIENGCVVTITPYEDTRISTKPVSQWQKTNSKKALKAGNNRNLKNKDKK